MNYFVCACGYKEDFQNEEYILGHMLNCNEFNNQSPLSKSLRQLKQLNNA